MTVPRNCARVVTLLCLTLVVGVPTVAQVDQERATTYFEEAAALCEHEGGRLWGVSLCGPMVIAEAKTGTRATNRPAPAPTPPAEEKRDARRKRRVAELRRRFVDGPVLVLPGAPGSFTNVGVTPIPGAGTVYPDVRVTAEWGRLEAPHALRSFDRSTIRLPAPDNVGGTTLKGDGWTLQLAPGWMVRPGRRSGDFRLIPKGR